MHLSKKYRDPLQTLVTKAKFRAVAFAAITTLALWAPANAAGVSGQGKWETTLLGRDVNRNAVDANSAAAVYLYDTTLKITWLREAGPNIFGKMNWVTANIWASDLVTGSGSNAVNDWRLPIMGVPNPSTESSSYGYNAPGSSSEMASLFYDTLGNKAFRDANGDPQSGYGLSNTGAFLNMQSASYWSGTATSSLGNANAWFFAFQDGGQEVLGKRYFIDAMAVRAGDVLAAPVPEPETYVMLLAGLALIGSVARQRRTAARLNLKTIPTTDTSQDAPCT